MAILHSSTQSMGAAYIYICVYIYIYIYIDIDIDISFPCILSTFSFLPLSFATCDFENYFCDNLCLFCTFE